VTSVSGEPEDDLPLTESDIDTLQRELARIYGTEERARSFLQNVRFPVMLIPAWKDAFGFWAAIFYELGSGAMTTPYRRMIASARSSYGGNQVLAELAGKDRAAGPRAAAPADGASRPAESVHRLVLKVTPDQRPGVEDLMRERGLHPELAWSVPTAASYRVSDASPEALHAALSARPEVGLVAVPPGRPDYLLRSLLVEGPDGRRFRFSDVPVQSPVSTIATEIVERYLSGTPGNDRPTVVDHVLPDGSGRRVNPNRSLFDEGIGEGSHLRVAFQRTAAVNPLDRRAALFRVRNQILEYVDGYPDFRVWPNSPMLPTEYDVEFTEASFGPPQTPGDPPLDITAHEFSIVLGPDFPITAPKVIWNSPIFHPNVFPNYDCETLRQRPYARGLVCLGTLDESYRPSLDFGELCAMLRDIAGYRNYSVYVPDGSDVSTAAEAPVLRGDYYDPNAAQWAISAQGQERICRIGGTPAQPRAAEAARFAFEIEPDT
jgi:Effector-associated domain 1